MTSTGVSLTALISEAANAFAFGPFLLIPERQQLLQDQEALRVGGRALDLLTALVQRHGEVVTKHELIAQVWPGLVVEEGNLKVNVSAIRRLLGDVTDPAKYIETVVGRGYRFVGDVRRLAHYPTLQRPETPPRTVNIKLPQGRLHGRDETVKTILRDLQDSRLVSIVGPGGIGKTSVAMTVAYSAAAFFQGGAWCVDLTALQDPALLPGAIADVLRESAGPASRSRGRSAPGRDLDILLVLDNCEHLVGAVASCVDQLLTSTRRVKFLTTSREPLSVRGELVRRLSGLELPPALGPFLAADIQNYPSVRLLVERAATQASLFHLDDENAADVVSICRKLDGHALAIERVARRIATLGVAGTLDHLSRRFHMLDCHHEGPERHRTLTATVATSYDLLPASEQLVLRRFAVFEGAFSLASACAIGEAGGIPPACVVESVGELVAKSLLLAETWEGEMRYRLTQLTRAFAVEQLIAHQELEDVRRQLAALALEVAAE